MLARRRTPVVLGLVVLAWSLLGCWAGDADSGSNPDSSTVRPGSDPDANADVAQRYFAAIASNDSEVQADGLEYAAPDSTAAVYLRFLSDSSAAYDENDRTREPGTATAVPAGYRVCSAGTTCLTYSDIVLADGRVNGFTSGGKRIDKNTALGKGTAAALGGLGAVEFLSRSLSVNTVFVVNLRVTSGSAPIMLKSAEAGYRERNGTRFGPVQVVGPTDLPANSEAHVLLVFDGVRAGPGRMDYTVTDADGHTRTTTFRTY